MQIIQSKLLRAKFCLGTSESKSFCVREIPNFELSSAGIPRAHKHCYNSQVCNESSYLCFIRPIKIQWVLTRNERLSNYCADKAVISDR